MHAHPLSLKALLLPDAAASGVVWLLPVGSPRPQTALRGTQPAMHCVAHWAAAQQTALVRPSGLLLVLLQLFLHHSLMPLHSHLHWDPIGTHPCYCQCQTHHLHAPCLCLARQQNVQQVKRAHLPSLVLTGPPLPAGPAEWQRMWQGEGCAAVWLSAARAATPCGGASKQAQGHGRRCSMQVHHHVVHRCSGAPCVSMQAVLVYCLLMDALPLAPPCARPSCT